MERFKFRMPLLHGFDGSCSEILAVVATLAED